MAVSKPVKYVNDLETWCLQNGEFGQQLMKEFTGELESGEHFSIDEISFGSGKKVKWRCAKGHEWFVQVNSRTNTKSNCPYCMRQKVSEINNLKNWCLQHGEYGQQLISEWTGESESGRPIEMNEVSYTNLKRLKWRCSQGHEWSTTIRYRTIHKTMCPYCSYSGEQKNSASNNLKDWCSRNGAFGQQLLSEWTGESEKYGHVNIDEVSYGMNKKVKWRCAKGHEWYARVNSRTSYNSGCPHCRPKAVYHQGDDYPKKLMYHCFKQLFPSVRIGCRVTDSHENSIGIEFDLGIPNIPLVIDYSITSLDKDRAKIINHKKELCRKRNIRFIQIIEDSYNELEHKLEPNYICFKMNESLKDENLLKIIDHILRTLGHSLSEVNIEKAKKKACERNKQA